MIRLKNLLALLAIACVTVFASCKEDKDEPENDTQDPDVEKVSIVGTWEMTDMDPYDNEYVERITLTADGKVSGRFKESGDYSNFTGVYSLEDSNLTVYVYWVEDPDESEVWKIRILSLESNKLKVRIDEGSSSFTMTFRKVSGNAQTDNGNPLIYGTWKMKSINPYDDEYVESITFTKDGQVSGRFKENNEGLYSYFTGHYTLEGNNLTIYALWQGEYDGEQMEVWKAKIINIEADKITIVMEVDDDFYTMEFVKEN